MAIGLDPKVNPYPGNPYLYGYGPEHRWFSYGDLVPPASPGAPPPGALPPPQGGQEVPHSIFEGDGARDDRDGLFQTPTGELEWEPMVGPKMSDVMAALAAAGTTPPGMSFNPTIDVKMGAEPLGFDPLEQSFAGYAEPGDFIADVGMSADRGVEETIMGDRATTRAHEFDEPMAAPSVISDVPAYSPPSEEEQKSAGLHSVAPGTMGVEVSGPLGIGGLRGSVGTDLRGWGETIGGTSPGALGGLAESAIGAMGGGGGGKVDPADFVNSPQGQAALSFAEGLLSRSPEQFAMPNDERAGDAFGRKGNLAGTHDYMSSLVDPGKVAAAATQPTVEYGYAPAAPAYSGSGIAGYSPNVEPLDLPSTMDQELIDNTPTFDELGNPTGKLGDQKAGLQDLINIEHLAEIIDPSTGALSLVGLDENQLAAYTGGDDLFGGYGGPTVGDDGTSSGGRGGQNDGLYGGWGSDDPFAGVSSDMMAALAQGYNDQAPAVGQPSPVAGFSTAIEAMQAANERGADYGTARGGQGDTGGTAPGGKANAGGYDKGSTPGQESDNSTGGGNTGTGSGGCYITTAAVDHMKLKDDGAHLKVLRWYRDNVLAKTPQGRKQIFEYKRVAPKIVQSLNKRKDAPEIYKALFTSYIDPAAQAVVKGDYADADNLYSSMVKQVADLSD